jgi:F420-dependent oxidoreductase-like protein
MRYALMTEPQQGLSYEEIRAVVQTAEESGFESFFRSDHYASFPGDSALPTTDAWATMAGLARDTTRITLGVLVSPVTFRVPGNFAKVVTTVAEMSGGRVEVGLGAGWNELEHARHGIPYPETGVRFEMLEDHLAILHGLWTQPDGWSYEGRHWSVTDARFYPKPPAPEGRRHPNVIVGGSGGPRMSALVARYADEMNISSASPARVGEAYQRLDAACSEIGRDPAEVTRSAMTGVLVGESEDDVRERISLLLDSIGSHGDPDTWLAERATRWIIGTPDQARSRVEEFQEAGVQRIMLQTFLPRDHDMVRLLARILVAG